MMRKSRVRGTQVQFAGAVAGTGGLAPMMVGAAPASESSAATMRLPSDDVVAEVPRETGRIGIVLAGGRPGRAELR